MPCAWDDACALTPDKAAGWWRRNANADEPTADGVAALLEATAECATPCGAGDCLACAAHDASANALELAQGCAPTRVDRLLVHLATQAPVESHACPCADTAAAVRINVQIAGARNDVTQRTARKFAECLCNRTNALACAPTAHDARAPGRAEEFYGLTVYADEDRAPPNGSAAALPWLWYGAVGMATAGGEQARAALAEADRLCSSASDAGECETAAEAYAKHFEAPPAPPPPALTLPGTSETADGAPDRHWLDADALIISGVVLLVLLLAGLAWLWYERGRRIPILQRAASSKRDGDVELASTENDRSTRRGSLALLADWFKGGGGGDDGARSEANTDALPGKPPEEPRLSLSMTDADFLPEEKMDDGHASETSNPIYNGTRNITPSMTEANLQAWNQRRATMTGMGSPSPSEMSGDEAIAAAIAAMR